MSKQKMLLVFGGVALAALGVIGTMKYSSSTAVGATQGAIGQRDVHRDNATSKEDVAVTPGAAPVVDSTSPLKGSAPDASGIKSEAVNSEAVNQAGRPTVQAIKSEAVNQAGRPTVQAIKSEAVNQAGRPTVQAIKSEAVNQAGRPTVQAIKSEAVNQAVRPNQAARPNQQ